MQCGFIDFRSALAMLKTCLPNAASTFRSSRSLNGRRNSVSNSLSSSGDGHFAEKWQPDEMVVTVKGKRYWLWRAVNTNDYVLDALLQSRKNRRSPLPDVDRPHSAIGYNVLIEMHNPRGTTIPSS